jgi:hypothetical protein
MEFMRKTFVVIATIMLIAFAGCAAGVKEGRPDNEDLRTAAAQYWTYRMNNDLGNAYYYENVSYTGIATRQIYGGGYGGSPVSIKGFEIIDIEEEGSGPEGYTPVKMKIKLSWLSAPFRVPDIMENEIRDLWVRHDNKWYHIQQKLTGFY